jgi:hypothetical protein
MKKLKAYLKFGAMLSDWKHSDVEVEERQLKFHAPKVNISNQRYYVNSTE